MAAIGWQSSEEQPAGLPSGDVEQQAAPPAAGMRAEPCVEPMKLEHQEDGAAQSPGAAQHASQQQQQLAGGSSEQQPNGEQQHGKQEAGGEPPFDPPYAPLRMPLAFWQDAALLLLLGGALGAFGWAYLKAITKVNSLWLTADGNSDFPSAPSSLGFGAGRPWWIGVVAGAGLVVGSLKALLGVDTVPSFLTELRTLDVHPLQAAKTLVISLLGLLAGVPMGPEAGLGAAAGAVGTLLGALRPLSAQAAPRRKAYVLSAMCSAFAALLPSPLASIALVLELGRPASSIGAAMSYMHIISLLTVGASASFVVYWAIAGSTYLTFISTIKSSLVLARDYDQIFIVVGIIFGAFGAAFGLLYILIAGLVKAAVTPLRSWLDRRAGQAARKVVLATAGGAAVGALGWAMPLVLTDGSTQLSSIMKEPAAIGSGALAASAFAKALAYHVSTECGFLGGLFLPMLAMSSMLGQVFVNETAVNPVVASACSLVALAAALAPAPLWVSILAISVLEVGPQGLVPLMTTAVTANLLLLGTGLPQRLLAAAEARKRAAGGGAAQ